MNLLNYNKYTNASEIVYWKKTKKQYDFSYFLTIMKHLIMYPVQKRMDILFLKVLSFCLYNLYQKNRPHLSQSNGTINCLYFEA